MSDNRGQRGEPSPPRRPIARGDRIILISSIAIVILAVGLVPFYLFTPARNVVRAIAPKAVPAPAQRVPTPTQLPAASPTVAPPAIATSVPDVPSTTPRTPIPLPTANASDQRFAFVLLGYGGGGHDGAYLTDSMMVTIVDPEKKTLTLLSLPRDSWVPMEFDGKTAVYNKINTAYAFAMDPSLYPDRLSRYTGDKGPGTFTADTVSQLLGIPVTYYLALDFQGFRDMINAVGGIDVDVPTGFVARYPVNDDPSINANWETIQFYPGPQHMSGERAIEYARARETLDNSGEGSDFARSRRQRLIMQAFKARMLQPAGLVQLPRLLGIANSHVDTNYTVPAVSALSQLILDWKDVQIYQTAITTDNYLDEATGPDGAYLLVPSEPERSWSQIRAFARHLWDNPKAGVAMASTTITIEDDGAPSSDVTRLRTNLVRLGYQVGPTVDGASRDESRLVDQTGTGAASALVGQLSDDLQGGPLTVTSDPVSGSPALVFQLGADSGRFGVSTPIDEAAPLSVVGVDKVGAWSPDAAPTAVETPIVVTTTDTIQATPLPTRVIQQATPIPVANTSGMVVVPNLVGLPEAEAQRVINQSDLMTTYVKYQTASQVADHAFFQSIAPGGVLSQLPPAGSRVPRGTRIALAVRKA
jgi:LCP family protein required for cell wall assembly